jgi:anti-anti-sigma factor
MSCPSEDQAVVVRLRGQIGSDNADVLTMAVLAAGRGALAVVVDLGDVTFIDSSGIRAVLICEAKLAGAGTEFRLRHPSARVREVLEMTNVGYMVESDGGCNGVRPTGTP